MFFFRQLVSSKQGTVSISIYGLGRVRGTGLGLYLQSLKELRVVGVFLEAETRHCEIKINCQGMFAIQIPLCEEGRGCWERGMCVKCCSICFLPLEALPMTHVYQNQVLDMF